MSATRFDDDEQISVSDIAERIERLEPLRQPGPVDLGDPDDNEQAQDVLFAELSTLESFLDGLCGKGGDFEWRGDWYPQTLIREDTFDDYAKDFAEDIGAVESDAKWPATCIDWTRAANELRIDYSSADLNGTTYLYR